MFDLAQLELLCAVGRSGSYSSAARELSMTQPAVTYQMQRLERALGATLTVRIGRTMRLTSTGELVRDHAERMLAEVRAAEHQIDAVIGAGTATVRVAAFPSGCATVVPAALARLRRSHPSLSVRVTQGDVSQIHEMVMHGEVDLALTYVFAQPEEAQSAPGQVGRLYRIPAGVDHVRLLLPAQHPAAAHSTVRIQELLEDTFLLGSKSFMKMLADLCRPLERQPRTMVMLADDYVTMQSFVAYGHGITLLPDMALRAHHNERVVARSLQGWPARHVAIDMWPAQRTVPAVTAVTEALLEAMPDHDATSRHRAARTHGAK